MSIRPGQLDLDLCGLLVRAGAQDASPFPYGTVYAASHTARLPSAVQQTADALECELVARRALAVAREEADKRPVGCPRKPPTSPAEYQCRRGPRTNDIASYRQRYGNNRALRDVSNEVD